MEATMDLRYLAESQNASFDSNFHSPHETRDKVARLQAMFGNRPFQILDVGGGNGQFVDSILRYFPAAEGTVIDISQDLLNKNVPHPRKTVKLCDAEELARQFAPQSFDVITINWLLHHLVGPTYETCGNNVRTALDMCRSLLKEGGVIIVAENMFEGFGGCNLPSSIIYRITTIQTAWVNSLIGKFFNTAGVGVCFRSTRAWRQMFQEMGLTLLHDDFGYTWTYSTPKKLAYYLLMIDHISHRHFYLR